MKYAVISDIHGNYPAFKAVLDDITNEKPDGLILVGDYIVDLPFPNEVIDTIRNLDNAIIIKGNRDGYLDGASEHGEAWKRHEQVTALAYNDMVISDVNRKFLKGLPEMVTINPSEDASITICHDAKALYGSSFNNNLKSSTFANKMDEQHFTSDEYRSYVKESFQMDKMAAESIRKSKSNLLISGHTHLQWHVEAENAVNLNPGSCGLPLDFKPGAAYSMVRFAEGKWEVEERRADYDIEKLIMDTKNTPMYEMAEIWSRIVFEELRTGRDLISFFFKTVKKVAEEMDSNSNPIENRVWRKAAELRNII